MDSSKEQLDAIKDIRNIMERSSRFISLSGLSGLAIGIIAILGVSSFYLYEDLSPFSPISEEIITNKTLPFVITDALITLGVALAVGFLMSVNRSKKLNIPFWNLAAKRLLINLFIPLITGGILCLILIQQGQFSLLAPITLLFYGLALVNASKYTIDEIRTLGILQIILGLIAAWKPAYGLLCWAVGFGILHIGYGIFIHNKQEKTEL
jgi:hypothetical protein